MKFKGREREYHREFYANYSAERKQRKMDLQRKRRQEIRIQIREIKAARGCRDCPERHPACLDFHHIGEKKFSIGDTLVRGFALDKLLKEIEKCEVLCSNCHRKLHDRG